MLASLALPLTAGAQEAPPTLDLDALQPGQKAVVRTVFQGERIESLEAEIVGVFHGGRVDGDIIVARATTERVIHSGIAQGMSGSPVYVDGKLVGALSGAWAFSKDPLFVVTPIREMLSVLDQPGGDAGDDAGTGGPAGIEAAGGRIAFGAFEWPVPVPAGAAAALPSPVESFVGVTGAGPGIPSRLALPVACSGLDPAVLPLARQILAPLGLTAVPGGSGSAPASRATLEPGGAVAVELMRGDLRMAAIGTVTWRDRERVLIFGHPFFQSGRVRLPLATANITTIVASELISFKLGMPGTPVGVATQDRRAAVGGKVGAPPHLMPVSVAIAATERPERRFHFESIEDRALAPQLVGIASLNSLLESGGAGPAQTVRWTVRMHRRGAAPLQISDVMVSDNLQNELAGGIAAPLRFLYNNPFSPLPLDSVTVRLEATPGRALWTLRSAEVLDAAVRPGSDVRVRCEIERWRGGRETVTLSLHVPEEVPEGRYVAWLGGGAELSRFEAQRLPGRYRPASLDEAWERLASYRPSDRLYAALIARAPEVTRDGRDYPELPTSALALLAGNQSGEDANRRGWQAMLDQAQHPLAGPLRGEIQLEVNVDPQAP